MGRLNELEFQFKESLLKVLLTQERKSLLWGESCIMKWPQPIGSERAS